MTNTLADEILDQLREIRGVQRESLETLARVDERLKTLERREPDSKPAEPSKRKALTAGGVSAGMVIGLYEGIKAVLAK